MRRVFLFALEFFHSIPLLRIILLTLLTIDLKLVFCVRLDCLRIQLRDRVKMNNFDGSHQAFSRHFTSEVIGEAEQYTGCIRQSDSKTVIL